MTHQPECAQYHPSGDGFDVCICHRLSLAYERGFRAGYNAHARAAQHWQDTHGAYQAADQSIRAALGKYEEAIRREEENP